MERKKRGIVVLGHPRSGTTMLRRILNGHSNIACPGETHLMSACARFLHAELTADGVDMGVLSGLTFAGFQQEDVIARLRDLALGFYSEYAKNQSVERWAEKTAVDSFFIDEIDQVFNEDVLYLGIIRHGVDVALSCEDFTKATGVFLENFQPYIRRFNQPLEAYVQSWNDCEQKHACAG